MKQLKTEQLKQISGGQVNDSLQIKKRIMEIASHNCLMQFNENNISIPFEHLGVDSISFTSLIFDVEDEFDILIDENSLSSIKSLNDLIRLVLTLLGI